MKTLLVKLIFGAFAVYIASEFVDGVTVNDFGTAFLVGLIISLLSAVVRPVLVVLTIPITIITLGMSLLALNAFMVIMADNLVDGFNVNGFMPALYFSILNWFFQLILNLFNPFSSKKD